jgi:hypothetical protein
VRRSGHHGINAVALRGQDGSGGARHLAYIALEWLQSKEGGDWGADLVGGSFGKRRPDGVRKKATLTRGPVASVRDRRTQARA